jgi:FlgO protein
MNFRTLKAGIFLVLFLMACSVLHSLEATITSMAQDLAKSLNAGTQKRVAVVDFTDLNGVTTMLGNYFAQQLEAEFANSTPRVDLINRTRLNEIMKENKLDATGLTDPETVKELGKIANVDALIVGTVTPLDQTVKLDVEAIGTEDARVLAATSRNVLKTRDILAVLEQAPVNSAPSAGVSVAPTSKPAGNPEGSRTSQSQEAEAQQVSFLLTSCHLSGHSVVSDFVVTNRADDRKLVSAT